MTDKITDKKKQWLVVFSLSIGILMASLDFSIVNVSLPTITGYFGTNTDTASWVVLSYFLANMGLTLVVGRVGDIWGFKKIYVWGMALFTLSSFMCGASQSIEMLIISRVMQGIGGAMFSTLVLAMISAYLPAEFRGKYIGIVSMCKSLGVMMGPGIGALITSYVSWKWVFFVNIPFGIAAFASAAVLLRQDTAKKAHAKFRIGEALLLIVSLTIFFYITSSGETLGWLSPLVLTLLVSSGFGIVMFVRTELKIDSPLINLSLLKISGLSMGLIANTLRFVIIFGMNFLLPFYFEIGLNISLKVSGLLLMIPSGLMVVMSPFTGRLSDRVGAQMLCILGMALSVVCFIMLTLGGSQAALWYVVMSMVVLGLSSGFFSSPNDVLIMSHAPKGMEGLVSSLNIMANRVGGTIGIIVFQNVVSLSMPQGMDIRPGVPQAVLHRAFENSFIAAAVLSAIVIVFSFLAKDAKKNAV
ncbi:MFS transporter [Candidatus Magnetominusculus xianensis]|uniref:Multidrug MFS transporter n=1 Tax=Candidatus Magnetominusculus xianensis TaxID=1748249 RepID=A0ABR5SFF9_9BACT|nr:MFS transporter [Candidatus Magnetominusculus xianensis]KWT85901.1 multidrug MFS transporter [Candidatus Magnetominusculus xianensis]MBF0403574.1 MFS transporter [Nitrospirota bacterium]